MDKISEILKNAERHSQEAGEFYEKEKFHDAYCSVEQSLHLYREVFRMCGDSDDEFQQDVRNCILSNTLLRNELETMAFPNKVLSGKTEGDSTASSFEGRSGPVEENDSEKYFENKIREWAPGPGFQSIIGLSYLKEVLAGCSLLRPGSEFAEKLRAEGAGEFNQHILLCGPPGNGKTIIVKAYQEETKGLNVINVAPADIFNRYVGEGEKRLDALFRVAARKAPVVIFFDEVDGLFGTVRRDGHNISLVDQLLLLLRSAAGVQVIAATNHAWEIDEAVRRRFDYIINVPLPNLQERKQLFAHYLGGQKVKFSDQELQEAASLTTGYSSSDVERATKVCLRVPTNKVLKAEAFKKVNGKDGESLWSPCDRKDDRAQIMRFFQVEPFNSIIFPDITFHDLKMAIFTSKASSDDDRKEGSLSFKAAEFARKFGTDGRDGGSGHGSSDCPKHSAPRSPELMTYTDPKHELCFGFHWLARDGKTTIQVATLLRLKYLHEAFEKLESSMQPDRIASERDKKVVYIATVLLQLRSLEESINGHHKADVKGWQAIQQMWSASVNQVLFYLKSSNVEQHANQAKESSVGEGDSPSGEVTSVVLQLRKAGQTVQTGAAKVINAVRRRYMYRSIWANNIEVIPHACIGKTPLMCCKRKKIKAVPWAAFGKHEVHVGVCKRLHVHYTIIEM